MVNAEQIVSVVLVVGRVFIRRPASRLGKRLGDLVAFLLCVVNRLV
jgi:hypothetical protein